VIVRHYQGIIDEQCRTLVVVAPTYQSYHDWCGKNGRSPFCSRGGWAGSDNALRGYGEGVVIVLLPGWHKVVHQAALNMAMYSGALVREEIA
jgi:hypothetical protein